MILITTVVCVAVGGQATAMTTQKIETKPAKRTSRCEQIMSWLGFAHADTSSQDKQSQRTSSRDTQNLSQVISETLVHFKDKNAENGAVVVCNIDRLLWRCGISPMQEALVTLMLFFQQRGYSFVFITTKRNH
jgi:hypothetical protein